MKGNPWSGFSVFLVDSDNQFRKDIISYLKKKDLQIYRDGNNLYMGITNNLIKVTSSEMNRKWGRLTKYLLK